MKYQTLHEYKYNGSGPSLSLEEVSAEYQRRLKTPNTWVTELHPLLSDTNGIQTDKFPIFFTFTNIMMSRIQKITKNSRRIQKLITDLPGVAGKKYTNEVLTNEIFFTNEIEGVKTNKDEIKTVIQNQIEKKSPNKKVRLASTVRMYLDILNQKIIKIHELKDIRNLYNDLLEGEISKNDLLDGELFRNIDHNVWVGTASKVVHTPPKNEKIISEKLIELINFMNDDTILEIPKAIISHFMFENTHPFYDGNGRTGRYLLSEYLASKIDPYTGLIISTSIHNEQLKYYKMFKEAERQDNFADLTVFIEDFLKIIAEGQNDVITNLNDKKERFARSARILFTIYPHSEPNNDNFNASKDFKNYRLFTILYVMLQSLLYDSASGRATDTEIINFLYNNSTAEFPKTKIKGLFTFLEDEGIIHRVSSNPILHTFSSDMRLKLNLGTIE